MEIISNSDFIYDICFSNGKNQILYIMSSLNSLVMNIMEFCDSVNTTTKSFQNTRKKSLICLTRLSELSELINAYFS